VRANRPAGRIRSEKAEPRLFTRLSLPPRVRFYVCRPMNEQEDVIPDQNLSGAGLVLSLRDGAVWASWADDRAPVRLGEHDAVLLEMRTFILQSEVAERLIRTARKPRDS
jgi:hypothetical protein